MIGLISRGVWGWGGLVCLFVFFLVCLRFRFRIMEIAFLNSGNGDQSSTESAQTLSGCSSSFFSGLVW